jgi:hypothetical protein
MGIVRCLTPPVRAPHPPPRRLSGPALGRQGIAEFDDFYSESDVCLAYNLLAGSGSWLSPPDVRTGLLFGGSEARRLDAAPGHLVKMHHQWRSITRPRSYPLSPADLARLSNRSHITGPPPTTRARTPRRSVWSIAAKECCIQGLRITSGGGQYLLPLV